MASALLLKPEAREKHFQRCAASATMSILYDHPTLETENDKTLKRIHAFNDLLSEAASPRSTSRRIVSLDDAHPGQVCSHFNHYSHAPHATSSGLPGKREGKKYFEQHTRMLETLFDNVQHDIVGGHSENLYPNLSTRRTTV